MSAITTYTATSADRTARKSIAVAYALIKRGYKRVQGRYETVITIKAAAIARDANDACRFLNQAFGGQFPPDFELVRADGKTQSFRDDYGLERRGDTAIFA